MKLGYLVMAAISGLWVLSALLEAGEVSDIVEASHWVEELTFGLLFLICASIMSLTWCLRYLVEGIKAQNEALRQMADAQIYLNEQQGTHNKILKTILNLMRRLADDSPSGEDGRSQTEGAEKGELDGI